MSVPFTRGRSHRLSTNGDRQPDRKLRPTRWREKFLGHQDAADDDVSGNRHYEIGRSVIRAAGGTVLFRTWGSWSLTLRYFP